MMIYCNIDGQREVSVVMDRRRRKRENPHVEHIHTYKYVSCGDDGRWKLVQEQGLFFFFPLFFFLIKEKNRIQAIRRRRSLSFFLFITFHRGKEEQYMMILDISAIEQATCDNIQVFFSSSFTLFFFHLILLRLRLCIPTYFHWLYYISKRKTMHCIHICKPFTTYIHGWIDLIIYPLNLSF